MTTTPVSAGTAPEPLLMSLSGVAELAGVQRAVASMWRTRFAGADAPFPSPAARKGGRDLFDAHDVAVWLAETGHGNNPDPIADAAASADGMSIDLADPDSVAELSALITLRAQSAAVLLDHGPEELTALARQADPDDTHLRAEIARHLERGAPWLAYVDALVDAAYSPAAALARMSARAHRAQRAHGSAGGLGGRARDLTVALVHGLVGGAERPALRIEPGIDAALFDAILQPFDGDADVEIPGSDQARALRRRSMCAGVPVGLGPGEASVVAVARYPLTPGEGVEAILAAVDEFTLGLGSDESAVVIAPARCLVDALPAALSAVRAETLRTGRVRAIVRLRPGLVTTASREALAMWVCGPHADIPLGDRVIALADLTEVELTRAAVTDLVSDILANLGGPGQARAHAFRFARLQRTSSVLARPGALVKDAAPRRMREVPASGDLSAQLDAAIQAAAADAPALAPTPQPGAVVPRTMTLADALAAGHVRVIPGTRVDVGEFGDDGLGVVTADDLDDLAAIGTRRVDQLTFAQAHPSAALTRSGDVVFRTSRSPRAWVDHSGSHVVAYPARVLRITPGDPGGLVPELVAADIAAGAAGPAGWRRWQVRVVDPAQVAPLRAVLAAASATREQLQDRIDRLDRMTALLADAVAARAVTLNDAPHR